MSLKIEHLMMLGAVGIGTYLFLGKKSGPASRIILQGSFTLAEGVPYRLTYETSDIVTVDPPTHTITAVQNDVRSELAGSGAYDVRFGKLPAIGKYSVSFILTPKSSLALAIGSQLSPSGRFAPRMKLISIARADGAVL